MGNQPNEGGAQKEPAVGLKRTLGLREAITIPAGTVIGVGLFTTGGNVVGEMGPFVVLATALAALISICPALMYGEMGSALPFAGGTYQYASLGLGRPAGFLAGWNFIMSLIAVTGGEALAFSYYFKTIFLAFGIELPVDDVVIAIIALIAFIIANVRGVELTGKLQNGFMFFFWGVAAIWFLTMIPNVQLPNFVTAPDFMGDLGGGGFIAAVAMIWWCFAGFETCCAMGEEIRHPQINIPRAMMLSPFIIFVVNALFQWFLVGIVPADGLAAVAESSAPYAEAMMSAGILGLPLALLALGVAFGGDFSTLNASIAVPPRYLFTMARDGSLPAVFAKLHPKHRTPYVAVITLGVLTVALVATSTLDYIASLSLFADLFYYVIGMVACLGLRRKLPDLKRPFKVRGMVPGAVISIVIYLVMMTQLDTDALVTGVIYCVVGLVIYAVCAKKYGTRAIDVNAVQDTSEPTPDERAKMDREFHIWIAAAAIGCALVALLYLLPSVLG